MSHEDKNEEQFHFNADIQQFRDLIITKFYSNKVIFLTGLISNASDALDKIKYKSITDPGSDGLSGEPNFKIKITLDKNSNTLTLQDTGIGMTRDELNKNLGTIAISGTKAFMEALSSGADISMTGKFGVGFYSDYLIADKVVVLSKAIGEQQYRLESQSDGTFFVYDDNENPFQLTREKGVILYLEYDNLEFLEEKRIKFIKKIITKQHIDLFTEISENAEDYKKYYELFSKNLKLGIHEDSANNTKLSEFLRFHISKSGEELISLKDYISKMKKGYEDIVFIKGESKTSVAASPFFEGLKKNDFQVLHMIDPIDEFAIQQLKEFDGKKLRNFTKEGLDLDQTGDEKKKFEKPKGLCKLVKEILGDKVEKVQQGEKLESSPPSVLVTGENGWSAHMERIMKAQDLRDPSLSSYIMSKKTLEINASHPILKELNKKLDEDKNDKTVQDLILLIYETALLNSGLSLDEPTLINKTKFMLRGGGCGSSKISRQKQGNINSDIQDIENFITKVDYYVERICTKAAVAANQSESEEIMAAIQWCIFQEENIYKLNNRFIQMFVYFIDYSISIKNHFQLPFNE